MRKLTTITGGKNKVTTFLINDGQIKETSFLEDINNLLNTAEIPNLFDPEEQNELFEFVRKSAKAEGETLEQLEALYNYFVRKCKANLHIIIAVSPIGDKFRNNVR
jgi:dynein heavy chain